MVKKSKAAVKDAFRKLDKDGSGLLDRSEVAQLANELGKPFSEADLSLAMQQLDTNGNGQVDLPAFEQFWASNFSGDVVAGTKLKAIMAQWADVQHVEGVAYHPDRYVDEDDEFRARVWFTFSQIDSNNDHAISYIEFISWWKKQDKAAHGGRLQLSDEVLQTSRQKFTEFAVANGSSLDRDELAGLLKALQLEKYLASAAAIETTSEPVPTAPSVTAEIPATDDAEAIVEGILYAQAETSRIQSVVKGASNAVLPPGMELGNDNTAWEKKDAKLTKNGLSWPTSGQVQGPIKLEDIKRVEPCDVDKQGFGLKIGLKNQSTSTTDEFIFSIEDEDERDEWIDSIKMVILQELNPVSKRQRKADERAKKSNQPAPDVDSAAAGRKVLAAKLLKDQVQQAFKQFDKDGSGSLDVKEIGAVAKACNKDLSPDELASMLAEIDADGNGSVDFNEFEQYWVSKFSGELVEGTALAAMLAAWTDVEHISGVAYHPDRYIDPDDEFRARVWYVFDEIDSNHDKCISYIEFINWWKKKDKERHHGQATISDDVLRESQIKFNEYDTNANGAIDRDELAGLLKALQLQELVPDMDDIVDDDAYKVKIHTAAHKDAGTDSKVSMTLYGENSDSGTRPLTTAKNLFFERGQISTFKLSTLELGKLTKLRIGHDNSGTKGGRPGAGWYLDKVVVSKKGMEDVTFEADRWLDSDIGDHQTTVELLPGVKPKKKQSESKHANKVMYSNPIYGPGAIQKSDAPATTASGSLQRKITIVSASDLINADLFDKSDPYCIISFNGKKVGKTTTIDNTCFPRWNESFTFVLPETREGILRIDLFDEDLIGADDPLGTVEVKLGGKSNPEALRACADYSFPDEQFTGHVTLSITHADARFATEEQIDFKDGWMQGMTYREYREKHVFEQWTRIYLLIATGFLTLFAIAIMSGALYVTECEDEEYIVTAYIGLAGLTLFGCSLGFYGAWRVKADVQAEKAKSEGAEATDDSGEDDGLQTTGQRVLEAYNILALLMIVFWTVLIAETYVRMSIIDHYLDGTLLHHYDTLEQEDACEIQSTTLKNLAPIGMIVIIVLLVSCWCCVKIVSVFEILQSLGECLCTFLLLCGIAVMFVSSFIVKQMICLNNPQDPSEWPSDAYGFLFFGIWGFVITAMSFLGFAAAYQESSTNLIIHAIAMTMTGVAGVVLVISIWASGPESFVAKGSDLCVPMLNAMSENVFATVFNCQKYYGPGMEKNSTGHWVITMEPSENPACFPKTSISDSGTSFSLVSYYWEVDSQSLWRPLYGCLNEMCCDEVVNYLQTYAVSIYVLSFWLLVVIFGSAATSLYLRKITAVVGHVMIHPQAKKAFWIMKIAMLAFVISCPFIMTGGSCQDTTQVHTVDIQSTLAENSAAAVATSSCNDNLHNGEETDVDCGGICDIGCALNRMCVVDSDCISGASCDDSTSICVINNGCYDGVQNNQETCEDGGGPVCRSEDQWCDLGEECQLDNDCRPGLFCGEQGSTAICHNCTDSIQSGDETDIDCGGDSCNKCSDGDACVVSSDCLTQSSCFNYICVSFSNGFQDGPETDVDCGGGGPSVACGLGLGCGVNSDCISHNCDSATSECIAPESTCNSDNGVQDGMETCVDGGGPICRSVGILCNSSQSCTTDADCYYNCHQGVCFSCSDDLLNGDEVDIDCGGSVCAKCADGSACTSHSDCSSDVCMITSWTGNGICVGYDNGYKDGTETDVDCGGMAALDAGLTCELGLNCTIDSDCTSNNCSLALCEQGNNCEECNAPLGLGLDTCVPGGGQACRCIGHVGCDDGSACTSDPDCESGNCVDSTCISCSDGVQNGAETDVDCGGTDCGATCMDERPANDEYPTGVTAQSCGDNEDCMSQNCMSGTCVSHTNLVQDADETDVDCGGSAPVQCGVGAGCIFNTDCSTGSCDINGLCEVVQTNTCDDNVQNGLETDVDCGGDYCRTMSPLCQLSESCEIGADCASQACYNNICFSCGNDVQDGDETDIDCGGTSCGGCLESAGCNSDADCADGLGCDVSAGSGVCASSLLVQIGVQTLAVVEPTCADVPHPEGLAGGCCDHPQPYGVPGYSCATLLLYGFSCNMVSPALDMPTDCPETCGLCAPIPDAADQLSVDSVPGGIVAGLVFLEGSGVSCEASANLFASSGVQLSLPNQPSDACSESFNVTNSSESVINVAGTVHCINQMLSHILLDSSCDTLWNTGGNTNPHDDVVISTVGMELLSVSGSACSMVDQDLGERTIAVSLTGRPAMQITGHIHVASSTAGLSAPAAGVMIDSQLDTCGLSGDGCAAIPHPQGLPGGCCDHPEPYGVPGYSCATLLLYGFGCDLQTPALDMPTDCPETCGLCPTPDSGGSDVYSATDGSFELVVPLSSAVSGEIMTLSLSGAGLVSTMITLTVADGYVDVGLVSMVSSTSVGTVIQGSCFDFFNLGSGNSHEEMSATLYDGHVVGSANSASESTSAVATTGEYEFAALAPGTYTVRCTSPDGLYASRHVYTASSGPAVFDPVAVPYTDFESVPFLVQIDWQCHSSSTTPDLDLHVVFEATQSESCHVFYPTPSCGDVNIPGTYQSAAGGGEIFAAWGDGPAMFPPSTVTALISAIQISVVRATIYTIYAQYNGVSVAEPTQLTTVSADIYTSSANSSSHLSHLRGTFQEGTQQSYVRLFCIDATDTESGPVVYPALLVSTGPPSMCTAEIIMTL